MDIRKQLENSAYDFSEQDAELFDRVYAKFEKNACADDGQKRRILSSAMRKAGFEMNETQANITVAKSRRKRFVKRLLIVAAAVLAIGGTVAATDTLSRVQEYFWQDMTPYADEIMKTAGVVSNDDITMSVDGVIADEVTCRVVVSLTAKTERGEDIIEQLNYSSHDYLEDTYKLQEKSQKHGSTDEEAHEWYVEQIKKLPPHKYTLYFENAGKTSDERYWEDMTEEEKENINYDNYFCMSPTNYYDKNKTKYHHYMMFDIEMRDLDKNKPLVLHETETGLSMDIDLNSYFDSHRLVSDDPNAFDYVVISPLAVYVRSTPDDIENGRLLKESSTYGGDVRTTVFVNFDDGTSEKLCVTIAVCADWDDVENLPEFSSEQEKLDYTEKHWSEQVVTEQLLDASGHQLFDLSKISSVTIDDVTYTIEK